MTYQVQGKFCSIAHEKKCLLLSDIGHRAFLPRCELFIFIIFYIHFGFKILKINQLH